MDRPATATDDLFRERTIEAVKRGEQAAVAKEARVTEEVVLPKDATERTETVRHTEVKVEDDTTTKSPPTDARLGTRHGSAPDGTRGNPPGTMASRGKDKTLGTNVSSANPQGENPASRANDKPIKP